jgi:hypothetical protein
MTAAQLLNSEVRHMISAICLAHPDWTARQVHAEIHRLLQERQYPRRNDEWPSYSAVQKLVTNLRRKSEGLPPDINERPWSLLAMSLDCCSDITAEALPAITRAWHIAYMTGTPLTIREARWIARLRTVVEEEPLLFLAAEKYAEAEMAMLVADEYPMTPEEMGFQWMYDVMLQWITRQDAAAADVARHFFMQIEDDPSLDFEPETAMSLFGDMAHRLQERWGYQSQDAQKKATAATEAKTP